jgi:hypothetical protein
LTLAFAEWTGYDAMNMNPYGFSLIYGHPQGPTAGKAGRFRQEMGTHFTPEAKEAER